MGPRVVALALATAIVASACSTGEPSAAPGTPVHSATPAATVAAPTAVSATPGPNPADTIFRGGPILTMTDAATVSALAVRGGSIVAVGSEAQVEPFIGPDTRVIDLGGRALLPGFVDPHTHLLSDMGVPILEAQQLALENGITSLADASVEPELLDRYLAAKDGLVLHVGLYLGRTSVCGDDLGTWYESYAPGTRFNEHLFVAGVKVFSDGGACRRIASSKAIVDGLPFEPPYFAPEALAGLVRTAHDAGYQVLIHAQGDLAVRDAQDAVAAVLGGGPNTLRHRIDHNAVVTADLRPRYGEIGIVPVIFGTFPTCAEVAWTDFWMANGEDWRSLVNANPATRIAWHGDDPGVPPLSPLHDLASYVTRADVAADGSLCRPPAWLADNTITVAEALPMMNVNAAFAIGLESTVGSLAEGLLADVIVVTADPTSVSPDELFDLEVVATFVGGTGVYCRPGDESLCG